MKRVTSLYTHPGRSDSVGQKVTRTSDLKLIEIEDLAYTPILQMICTRRSRH